MSAATAEQLERAATAPAATGTEAPQSIPLRPTLGGTVALLVYSAGFFAALITMRSLMMTTTLFLPAIALIAYARFLLANRTSTGS